MKLFPATIPIVAVRVCSHERRNELIWNDFISVENLTSVFSQLFTCVQVNWGGMKLKTLRISYRSFWQKLNFILGDKISCKHYPKWNTYTCPSKKGPFWNAAEMKLHVNGICFHAGLKSQTSMSSFRLSCERALRNLLFTLSYLFLD